MYFLSYGLLKTSNNQSINKRKKLAKTIWKVTKSKTTNIFLNSMFIITLSNNYYLCKPVGHQVMTNGWRGGMGDNPWKIGCRYKFAASFLRPLPYLRPKYMVFLTLWRE